MRPDKNIPDELSSANAWKLWHGSLKSALGRKQAAVIFVSAWDKRGNKDVITVDLNNYLEKYGIKLDTNFLGTVIGAGADIADTIGGVLKVGKYAVYGLVGIVVVGTGILVFQIVKNPIKSAQAAATFTPAGRAATVAGS